MAGVATAVEDQKVITGVEQLRVRARVDFDPLLEEGQKLFGKLKQATAKVSGLREDLATAEKEVAAIRSKLAPIVLGDNGKRRGRPAKGVTA